MSRQKEQSFEGLLSTRTSEGGARRRAVGGLGAGINMVHYMVLRLSLGHRGLADFVFLSQSALQTPPR